MKKILNGQNIRIITNQTKSMAIKQQQEPKESFVVVNKNPTSTKKKQSFLCMIFKCLPLKIQGTLFCFYMT